MWLAGHLPGIDTVYQTRRLNVYRNRLTLMRKTASDVLKAMRRHARRNGWTVEQLPKRGKGSHAIWAVVDENGEGRGRIGLTGHSGEMSHTVTRSCEEALEPIFGEAWLR